jgi:hypothetical protein
MIYPPPPPPRRLLLLVFIVPGVVHPLVLSGQQSEDMSALQQVLAAFTDTNRRSPSSH